MILNCIWYINVLGVMLIRVYLYAQYGRNGTLMIGNILYHSKLEKESLKNSNFWMKCDALC
jgi:hypothetical protein